jgi:hypothetical protein
MQKLQQLPPELVVQVWSENGEDYVVASEVEDSEDGTVFIA